MSDGVERFRSVIDETVASNVRRIESSPGRPIDILDYRHVARFGDLTYVSLDREHARPAYFNLSDQHLWGMGIEGLRLSPIRRKAFMSIVSVEGVEDSLTRRIEFGNGPAPARTELLLDSDEQVQDAIKLATSPQLADSELSRLAILTSFEVESVTRQIETIEESERQFADEMEEIHRAEREAWRDARDIIIF